MRSYEAPVKLESESPRSFGSWVPKSRYLFVMALILFVVGFLQALDVIELPLGTWFSWLSGSILSSSTLNSFISTYGYASIFALMALENQVMGRVVEQVDAACLEIEQLKRTVKGTA
jgi:phospholipid N-methyltransferase